MTLSDPVLLAVLGGIGTGFLMLVRWLKEDRDYWRDRFMETTEQAEVATELAEKKAPERLSPDVANHAQLIISRTRRRG